MGSGDDVKAERERTYDWGDSSELAAVLPELSGLEFLTRMMRGELPGAPIASTLEMRLVEAEEGRVVFELDPAEWHHNPIGSVHGGVLSTMLDSALGCAVHSQLSAGTGYTSLDLSVKFTRAATYESGTLRCEGRVVTIGRRVATSEASIADASGRILAHGISSCLLMPLA